MVSLFFSFWSPHQRQEIVRLMRMLPSAPCGAEPLAIYHICVFNFSWECSFCSQFSSSDSESTAAFWSVSDLPAPRAQAAPRRPRCRKPPSPRWSEGTTPGPGCGGRAGGVKHGRAWEGGGGGSSATPKNSKTDDTRACLNGLPPTHPLLCLSHQRETSPKLPTHAHPIKQLQEGRGEFKPPGKFEGERIYNWPFNP